MVSAVRSRLGGKAEEGNDCCRGTLLVDFQVSMSKSPAGAVCVDPEAGRRIAEGAAEPRGCSCGALMCLTALSKA